MPEICGHVIKLFSDCRGGGAGRATAQPLVCLGLGLQHKINTVACKCTMNGGTVTPDTCLSSLARVFSPNTSSLRSLLFLSHDQDLAIY